MKYNSISTSSSVKLPVIKVHQKLLITEPDDKGFAKDQSNKIIQGLYLRNQLKLKPWEKDSFKNIYKSSGKSNHQILQNLRQRVRSSKTININELSNKRYFNEEESKSIDKSQEIVKQIQLNSDIRKKFNPPPPNIKAYTVETKEICKNNMKSEYIKIERDKMQKRLNDYERALKNEMKNLERDIFKFEQYSTNELLKRNLKYKYIFDMESNRKNLVSKIKKLTQEYHALQDEIPKILKKINGKKIYVNFIHKLFGGEPELANCNLDNMNFLIMRDEQLHAVTNMVQSEMDKTANQENVLVTSTEDDLIQNVNKLDVVFKILEENIMKTIAVKEKILKETVIMQENGEKEKENIKNDISQREKEYEKLLEELQIANENVQIFSPSKDDDYISYVRNLHIELFECVKDCVINNKKELDEYNIVDKVIKPVLNDINKKERKIDSLIIDMERFSKEDRIVFNNSVNKIKNENKILKLYEEKNNREIENSLRNAKILEKINKIMITGKHKYKNPIPLNILKKRKNNEKELKTEPSDFKLIYY